VNKHLYLCHPLVLSSPTLMMHGHMNLKFIYMYFYWKRLCILIVVYVFLLLVYVILSLSVCCLCILIVVYVFLDAATLTEVFPCFFLLSGKCQGITSQDGARPALSQIVVLFYVLFVLCRSVFCLCVNVHCTTATG